MTPSRFHHTPTDAAYALNLDDLKHLSDQAHAEAIADTDPPTPRQKKHLRAVSSNSAAPVAPHEFRQILRAELHHAQEATHQELLQALHQHALLQQSLLREMSQLNRVSQERYGMIAHALSQLERSVAGVSSQRWHPWQVLVAIAATTVTLTQIASWFR
jgi:hypothetical protein